MTKLTEKQQLNLDLVIVAVRRVRDARRALDADIRRELTERSRHLYEARNEAFLTAHESGVPISQISFQGLGSKHTETVREAMDAARQRRAAFAPLAGAGRKLETGTGEREVVLTLSGEVLDAAGRFTGWTAGECLAAGVASATFRVERSIASASDVLIAVTPSFVEAQEKPHPVVAWGRAHASELLQQWSEDPA